MEKDTLVLPSLSPVGDRPISVMIDARCTSADGGVLLFQDVERRLNLANRLAACLHDPRRTELYRMAEAMLDLYCDSFPVVPHHLTLDLDESFDRVHGEQELRKFNAYYDDWGFLPIHICDTSGRLVVSVLREASTPSGREILTLVKRVVGHIRERFPRVRIRLRGDSHYACPEVMSWCEANGLEYIFGLAGTAPLAAQVQTLEGRTAARYTARRAAEPPKFKLRRYMDFQGGAKSWNCQHRIVAGP